MQATLSNLPRHEPQAVHWSRNGGETVYGIASAPILAMAAFGLCAAARYVTAVLEKAFLKSKRFSASERNPSCCRKFPIMHNCGMLYGREAAQNTNRYYIAMIAVDGSDVNLPGV